MVLLTSFFFSTNISDWTPLFCGNPLPGMNFTFLISARIPFLVRMSKQPLPGSFSVRRILLRIILVKKVAKCLQGISELVSSISSPPSLLRSAFLAGNSYSIHATIFQNTRCTCPYAVQSFCIWHDTFCAVRAER